MDLDASFKSIRKLQRTLFGVDADVSLTYKGTEFGVTKCWHARVGDCESDHESYDGAITQLTDILKKKLNDKISSNEREATRLRQVLNAMEN